MARRARRYNDTSSPSPTWNCAPGARRRAARTPLAANGKVWNRRGGNPWLHPSRRLRGARHVLREGEPIAMEIAYEARRHPESQRRNRRLCEDGMGAFLLNATLEGRSFHVERGKGDPGRVRATVASPWALPVACGPEPGHDPNASSICTCGCTISGSSRATPRSSPPDSIAGQVRSASGCRYGRFATSP